MATTPPSPKCLERGPRLFWLHSEVFSFFFFSLLYLPRARSDFTQRGAGAAMLDEWRREQEGKSERRGEEGGMKSRGMEALGGGRAKI